MIVGSLLLILVAVALLVAGVLSGSNALIICCMVLVVLAAIVLVIGVKQAAVTADPEFFDDDADIDDAHANDVTGQIAAVTDSGFRRGQPDGALMGSSGTARTRRGMGLPPEQPATRPDHDLVVDSAVAEGGPLLADDPVQRFANPAAGTIPAQGTVDGRDHAGRDRYAEAFAPAADGGVAAARDRTGAAPVDLDDDPPDEPSAQIVTASNAARVATLGAEVLVVDGRPRYHVAGCIHLMGRQSEPLPVGEAVELGFSPCGLCEPDSALLAEARRV